MASPTHRPDFVIAGFAKTASTTLAARLASHPSICFSNPKEPNSYLAEGYPALDRYPPGSTYDAVENGNILGEGSVRYGMSHLYPEAAENLYAAAPDARLVFIVRDPVQRAISHWRMLLNDAPDLLSPEEMLDHDWAWDALVTTGCYRKHLEHFLQHYSEDQLLVLDFPAVTSEYDAHIGSLLSFIDPSLTPEKMDHERSANVTTGNRFVPSDALVNVRQFSLFRSLARLAPEALKAGVRKAMHRPPPRPEISETFRQRVLDAAGEDYQWALEFSKRNAR